ncbi:hypothetical protein [Flammeovirga aprica]|uniref:Uncharacterized protein n=1 Tax=Flammeovirga aprica JL-4 TaxID=694437 RepID=A0A7X9XA14_9BACT|nr:hypothetical protein [Flammeovirga aprica]NME69252.1 hypothetical protein [Flammeovirga aprica JL-4]
MKQIYKYIGVVLALIAASACDPLKDINDQITDGRPSENFDYTLTEDDYDLSCSEAVQRFKSFSQDVPPDNDTCGVAQILDQKFLGVAGDVLNATYDYYNPLYKGTTVQYKANQADYDRFGQYGNLNLTQSIIVCDSIFTLTSGKTAVKTDVVALTANYYDGRTTHNDTLIEYISFGSPIWHQIYVLQTSDYELMEQATNPNFFTSKSNALHRIPTWLKQHGDPYANAGDTRIIQYTVREFNDQGTAEYKDYVAQFDYNGAEWENISDTSPQTSAFKWSAENSNWAISPVYTFTRQPDETEPTDGKEYTLTASDYSSVGESFPNFDTRNNTQEDIDRKIGIILNSQSEVNIEENDNIKVNYAVYPSGSAPTEGVYKATL